MQLRRPLAALVTSMALVGGGATLAACGDPATPNEGTTEDESVQETLSPDEAERENLPGIHDADPDDPD